MKLKLPFVHRLPFVRKRRPVVSVLRLDGAIGASMGRFRGAALNIQSQAARIERAFRVRNLSAVALVVNSPGGSAAQASLIAKRVRDLAEEKDVPILAFAEDIAASGGYWLACAADEIIVDQASIVGSIGVITSGFGFQELIGRHGVERRVHVTGPDKAALDPFLPERPQDIERLRSAQAAIHESFKAHVRERRGDRLDADQDALFSGAFWVGEQAVRLGLADAVGDIRSVLRERYGETVRMVPIADRRAVLRSIMGRTQTPPPAESSLARIAAAVLSEIEERLIWARFGL